MMSDNEIIKALECCCKNNNCDGCPLDYLTFSSQCASELAIKSLDLINRQKAEIERLNKEVDRLSQVVLYHDGDVVDAVKEFAERLKSHLIIYTHLNLNDAIDNLVKEMVGDSE